MKPNVNSVTGNHKINHHYVDVCHYYRPQRSLGKVMFLYVSVILFTGGVCPITCWDAHPPQTRGRYPPDRGRHPPRPEAGTPPRPEAGTPHSPGPEAGTPTRDQRQAPPRADTPPSRSRHPPSAVHAGRYWNAIF